MSSIPPPPESFSSIPSPPESFSSIPPPPPEEMLPPPSSSDEVSHRPSTVPQLRRSSAYGLSQDPEIVTLPPPPPTLFLGDESSLLEKCEDEIDSTNILLEKTVGKLNNLEGLLSTTKLEEEAIEIEQEGVDIKQLEVDLQTATDEKLILQEKLIRKTQEIDARKEELKCLNMHTIVMDDKAKQLHDLVLQLKNNEEIQKENIETLLGWRNEKKKKTEVELDESMSLKLVELEATERKLLDCREEEKRLRGKISLLSAKYEKTKSDGERKGKLLNEAQESLNILKTKLQDSIDEAASWRIRALNEEQKAAQVKDDVNNMHLQMLNESREKIKQLENNVKTMKQKNDSLEKVSGKLELQINEANQSAYKTNKALALWRSAYSSASAQRKKFEEKVQSLRVRVRAEEEKNARLAYSADWWRVGMRAKKRHYSMELKRARLSHAVSALTAKSRLQKLKLLEKTMNASVAEAAHLQDALIKVKREVEKAKLEKEVHKEKHRKLEEELNNAKKVLSEENHHGEKLRQLASEVAVSHHDWNDVANAHEQHLEEKQKNHFEHDFLEEKLRISESKLRRRENVAFEWAAAAYQYQARNQELAHAVNLLEGQLKELKNDMERQKKMTMSSSRRQSHCKLASEKIDANIAKRNLENRMKDFSPSKFYLPTGWEKAAALFLLRKLKSAIEKRRNNNLN
eukprot:g4387.t1